MNAPAISVRDRKANQAFAIYAAHIRLAWDRPALRDDDAWQAKRERTYQNFLTAFGEA